MIMEAGGKDNKKRTDLGAWEGDQNEKAQDSKKLQSDLVLLSNSVSSPYCQSPYIKVTEDHLQQILLEYKALNCKITCRNLQTPPTARPLTLCMECLPENDFSHWDILKAIEQIVPKAFEKKRLTKIQFENTNVICETEGHKNRWLISVSDYHTRDHLLCSSLVINGETFFLRYYDDVILNGYKQHLRQVLFKQEMLDVLSDASKSVAATT